MDVSVADLKPASALVLDEPLEDARPKAERVLAAGPWPRVYFGHDGTGRPALKRQLENVKKGKVPTTWWADDDYDEPLELDAVSWPHQESGHSQTGIDELLSIEPAKATSGRLVVRLVSEGKWNADVEQEDSAGYTVWGRKQDNTLRTSHVESVEAAVKRSVTKDSS